MNGPKVVPRKEERDSNKTAPMQILYYRGTFRKLSPKYVSKKQRFIQLFYNYVMQGKTAIDMPAQERKNWMIWAKRIPKTAPLSKTTDYRLPVQTTEGDRQDNPEKHDMRHRCNLPRIRTLLTHSGYLPRVCSCRGGGGIASDPPPSARHRIWCQRQVSSFGFDFFSQNLAKTY